MGRAANDIRGLEFGSLRALELLPGKGKARWRCHCDPRLGGCGREKAVLAQNLVGGHTRSCGCRQGHQPAPIDRLITI